MSMYNLLSGKNPSADLLMMSLNLNYSEVGRFRDIYITGDGFDKGKIVLMTRNGGGNRKHFQEVFDKLEEHPNYLYDKDWSKDCTYAKIYFSIPEELLQEMKEKEGI